MTIEYDSRETEDDFKPHIGKLHALLELADVASCFNAHVRVSKSCYWIEVEVLSEQDCPFKFSSGLDRRCNLSLVTSFANNCTMFTPIWLDEFNDNIVFMMQRMSGLRLKCNCKREVMQTPLGHEIIRREVYIQLPHFSSAEELKLKMELMS